MSKSSRSFRSLQNSMTRDNALSFISLVSRAEQKRGFGRKIAMASTVSLGNILSQRLEWNAAGYRNHRKPTDITHNSFETSTCRHSRLRTPHIQWLRLRRIKQHHRNGRSKSNPSYRAAEKAEAWNKNKNEKQASDTVNPIPSPLGVEPVQRESTHLGIGIVPLIKEMEIFS